MNRVGLLIAASAVALGAAPSAQAADLIIVDEVAIAAATSSWDGLYIGAGVSFLTSSSISENIWALDGIVGFNATFDSSWLLGAEAYASARNSDFDGWYGAFGAEGRAGFLLNDMALIYAAVGAETTSGGASYWTVGGGVEFLVSEDLSIDLEYKHYEPISGSWTGDAIGVSLNWHF